MKHLYALLIALCLPLGLSANKQKEINPLAAYGVDKAINDHYNITAKLYGLFLVMYSAPVGCTAGLAAGIAAAYNPTSIGKYFAVGLGGGAMGNLLALRNRGFLPGDLFPEGLTAALGAVWATSSFVVGFLGGLAIKTAQKSITG